MLKYAVNWQTIIYLGFSLKKKKIVTQKDSESQDLKEENNS